MGLMKRGRRPAAGPAGLCAWIAFVAPALSAVWPDAAGAQSSPSPAPVAQPAPSRSGPEAPPGPIETAPGDDEDDAPTPPAAARSGGTRVSGVTVTARRPPPQPGAVIGDIKPELQLSPSDIQSYGVSSVTELLDELAPETRSDRGRGGETPVVLLNGRRISSLAEIQNIPTEAILRVDILPEEVSLKYGYTADQRVVNVVLRRRFRAITGELIGGGPTEGGREQGQAEADLLHLRGDTRLNLDLKYQGSSEITDAARGIVEPPSSDAVAGNVVSPNVGAEIDPALSALAGQTVTIAGIPTDAAAGAPTLGDFAATANRPNVTGIGQDRTLSPATQSLTANAVLAEPIPFGLNATVNGTLGATRSVSLQGLPGVALTVPQGDPFSPFDAPVVVDRYVDAPLRQTIDGWTAHLGSTLNRDVSDWRLSLTDAYDHADTATATGEGFGVASLQEALDSDSPSFNPFAPLPGAEMVGLPETRAEVRSDTANVQLLANGPFLDVPAGHLYVSAKAGDTQSWLSSSSPDAGVVQDVDLSRNDANAQLNLDLPLASRDHHVLPWIGELSANMNAAVDQLSDYGTLKAFGYGLNWTPIPGYNLIVSHTNDQAAPTVQQLGDPVIQTPGVRVFDYATGQTVTVTQVSGGDAALQADNRNVFKVGLTIKPIPSQNLTLVANYIRSDIDHAIATFPAADAAIEAAFPDRFPRNADGELEEEDERPVNFARTERAELRWGLDYSRPIGPQPPPRLGRGRYHRSVESGSVGPGGAHDAGQGGAPGEATPDGASLGAGQGRADGDGAGPRDARDDGDRGGGLRGGGFGGRRGGFGPGGRLQVAVYHTLYFVDRELVRPGGPLLDLLNGAAASSTGGQYRNEVQAQLGMTLFGFGARLSADWRSATFVQGGQGSATGDLFFSDITTINLRLFDNFGQQPWVVRRYAWLRGTRATLNITNLFDQRIGARDAMGVTPIGYQPGYIDPVGRTVTLSVRKLFF